MWNRHYCLKAEGSVECLYLSGIFLNFTIVKAVPPLANKPQETGQIESRRESNSKMTVKVSETRVWRLSGNTPPSPGGITLVFNVCSWIVWVLGVRNYVLKNYTFSCATKYTYMLCNLSLSRLASRRRIDNRFIHNTQAMTEEYTYSV